MRCANSEMYVQKAKAEKQVKQIAQKYKEQKLKSIAETSKVVERMQKVCERRTSVAVHDATVHLQRDLTTYKRGEKGLKYTLGKSKVHFCICRGKREALANFLSCLHVSYSLLCRLKIVYY